MEIQHDCKVFVILNFASICLQKLTFNVNNIIAINSCDTTNNEIVFSERF